MVVGAGRPQPASLAAMPPPFTSAKPPPFTSAKKEYSLDDDLVALDDALDEMGFIDNFLKTFLGAQEFKVQRCCQCS